MSEISLGVMISVLISAEVYARSFLNDQILDQLLENYDVILIKQPEIEIDNTLKSKFHAIVDLDFNRTRKHFIILLFQEILGWKFKNKSRTFRYKLKRKYPSIVQSSKTRLYKTQYKKYSKVYKSYLHKNISDKKIEFHFGSNYFISKFREFAIKILSTKFFFLPFVKIAKVEQIVDLQLFSVLKKYDINLIIFPTGSMMAHDQIVLNTAKKNATSTFYLMDNWDNLSSKSVFWSKPDFLGTWGPQTSKHALDIQGFKPSQIIQIGSARFTGYKQIDHSSNLNLNGFKYILFIGSVYRYRELDVLVKLDRFISENHEVYKGLKIVYRPYPGSERIQQFQNLNLVNVQLDIATLQLYEQELSENENRKLKVKLAPVTYYPDLIGNSLFCIGGLSSMILEATLMKKTYLAIAFFEKYNDVSPHYYLQNYTHLEEIEILPNLKILKNEIDLFSSLDTLVKTYGFSAPVCTNSALEYFLITDTSNFGTRLLESVNYILKKI